MAESVEKLEDGIVRSAEQVSSQIRAAKEAIGSVIFGQDRVIENTLVTILSGGHALLIGVPGLAKTKLVETLGVTLGLDAKRIQFTPDLMPSDILGAEVLDESTAGRRAFRFIAGPASCDRSWQCLHRAGTFKHSSRCSLSKPESDDGVRRRA